jgi:hypothetical protein
MKFPCPLFAQSAPLVVLVCALSSCIQTSPPGSDYLADVGGPARQRPSNGPYHAPPAIPDDVSYWDGDGVSGAPLIKISRKDQKAFFYKGNLLVGVSRISSGKEDHGTPNGRYKIIQLSKDHRSSKYGVFKDKITGATINDDVDTSKDKVPPGAVFVGAPMPNFMRFNGGVGMHTGYLPGYAASHGCVRMPHQMSEKFFENVKIGTPVIVE